LGKPAARVGDKHRCPLADPVTEAPHKGGIISGGCSTVLIGGKAAAVTGDACTCEGAGAPNMITGGSTGVFIGGKPAARKGDGCAHGGKVTGGFGSVLIGERGTKGKKKGWKEPSTEEKVKLINKAIKTAIKLLTDKLLLLEMNDVDTVIKFKKWFGRVDDVAKRTIVDIVKKSLNACSELTCKNFIPIYNEYVREKEFARVYNEDNPPVFYIGKLFWKCRVKGKPSRASTIIHELSHFKYIGNMEDVIYGEKRCEDLAKDHPGLALKNADSYELFILS